jgi:hypothetical protein
VANLPVPVPRTATVSEVETGAYANSIRDALNFLVNVPAAFVTQANAQAALTTNTWTAISFDASVFDSYGGHSNSTNNSRYVAQVPGWYIAFGCVSYNATVTTGNRGASVAKNGTRVQGAAGFANAFAGNPPTIPSPPCIVFLNTGDYIEVQGYSSAASVATQVAADLDSSMTVVWVHA